MALKHYLEQNKGDNVIVNDKMINSSNKQHDKDIYKQLFTAIVRRSRL